MVMIDGIPLREGSVECQMDLPTLFFVFNRPYMHFRGYGQQDERQDSRLYSSKKQRLSRPQQASTSLQDVATGDFCSVFFASGLAAGVRCGRWAAEAGGITRGLGGDEHPGADGPRKIWSAFRRFLV